MGARFLFALPLVTVAAGCGGSHAAEPPPATPAPGSLAAPVPHLNPYKAAVAYARCMRARGVPHPDPDANGDFHLTPAQDKAMQSVPRKQHEAADAACFHLLKGTVSTQPLSRGARQAALVPLGAVRQCMLGFGYRLGKPIVKNMSRGRAMFGFQYAPQPKSAKAREKIQGAQHTCEKRVKLAAKIDAIIKADRGENR
jgi:hypothetical protein